MEDGPGEGLVDCLKMVRSFPFSEFRRGKRLRIHEDLVNKYSKVVDSDVMFPLINRIRDL
jgi:hypothetical protein